MEKVFSVLNNNLLSGSEEDINRTIRALKDENVDAKTIFILSQALGSYNLYERLVFADEDKQYDALDKVVIRISQEFSIDPAKIEAILVNVLQQIRLNETGFLYDYKSLSTPELRRLFNVGDEKAMIVLASRLFLVDSPQIEEENILEAYEIYRELVNLGNEMNVDALSQLGIIYLKGYKPLQIMPDPKKAVNYLTKASEAGNRVSMLNLAKCCLEGNGVEKNVSYGVDLLIKAIENNDSPFNENIENEVITKLKEVNSKFFLSEYQRNKIREILINDRKEKQRENQIIITEESKQDEVSQAIDEQDNMIHCPKCNSTQITAKKRGFGVGKAVVGHLILGPIGLLGGFHKSSKMKVVCLNCGKEWNIQ